MSLGFAILARHGHNPVALFVAVSAGHVVAIPNGALVGDVIESRVLMVYTFF
jgi:hypothetical protein